MDINFPTWTITFALTIDNSQFGSEIIYLFLISKHKV